MSGGQCAPLHDSYSHLWAPTGSAHCTDVCAGSGRLACPQAACTQHGHAEGRPCPLMSVPHRADNPRARDRVTAWGTRDRVTTVCELRQENRQGHQASSCKQPDLGSVAYELCDPDKQCDSPASASLSTKQGQRCRPPGRLRGHKEMTPARCVRRAGTQQVLGTGSPTTSTVPG